MSQAEKTFKKNYEELRQKLATDVGTGRENLNLLRRLEGMLPEISSENKGFCIQQINYVREHYGIPLIKI